MFFCFCPSRSRKKTAGFFTTTETERWDLQRCGSACRRPGRGSPPSGCPPDPAPLSAFRTCHCASWVWSRGLRTGTEGMGCGGEVGGGHGGATGTALLTAEGAEVGAGWVVTGWPAVRRLRRLWVLWAVGGEGAGHPGLVCPPRQQGGGSRPGRRGRVPPSWLPAPRSPALARHQHPRAPHLFPVMEVPGWQVARAWPTRADSSRSFLGHLSSARSPQTLPHTPTKA